LLHRIKASGLKLRFCTNETQATREKFVKKLQGMGFDISVAEVTAPAPAACRILKERSLRPHLLVHNGGTTLRRMLGRAGGQPREKWEFVLAQ